MTNSVEEAKKEGPQQLKYVTRDLRSWGGSRVATYVDGDYRTWTEDDLAAIVAKTWVGKTFGAFLLEKMLP